MSPVCVAKVHVSGQFSTFKVNFATILIVSFNELCCYVFLFS